MNWYLKVFRQYAVFKGRARRKEFWVFFLFNILISYSIVFLDIYFETPELTILSTIYSLGVLIPSVAVAVRRIHDAGKSGWYILIPVYNLILACTVGNIGENKFGNNPKDKQNKKV